MPSSFEKDVRALARRFAHDVLARARREPLRDLARALGSPAPAGWQQRYDLTEAESYILEAAVSGKTRAEIARARGTAPATIKKQIHELLAKTEDPSLLAAATRLLRERAPFAHARRAPIPAPGRARRPIRRRKLG